MLGNFLVVFYVSGHGSVLPQKKTTTIMANSEAEAISKVKKAKESTLTNTSFGGWFAKRLPR